MVSPCPPHASAPEFSVETHSPQNWLRFSLSCECESQETIRATGAEGGVPQGWQSWAPSQEQPGMPWPKARRVSAGPGLAATLGEFRSTC